MIVLSHRGRHAGSSAPDNSLDAVRGALAAGFEGAEIDVRRSRDGAAVLFHDRRARNGRDVASLTRAELADAEGRPIDTLDDVVAAFPDAFLDVELKTEDALDVATPALLRADPSRVLVTSFLHDVVASAAARLELPCGLIVAHRPATPDDGPWGAFAATRAVRCVVADLDVCDAATVAAAHAAGFRFWAWGIGSAADRARAAALGLDGAICDA